MKYSRRLARVIAWLWIGFFAMNAWSHSGGQDDNGGHVDKTTGKYHCHRADCVLPDPLNQASDFLKVVSFNIQFLGNFKKRDDEALAAFVANNDIVVIQELVAPPFAGTFPDNQPYRPDAEAREFFDAMQSHGFRYILSEEDTGTGNRIHLNSTATEWFVTFYKPESVQPELTLPNGFLELDRSNHQSYERVPYATPFRNSKTGNDFVLISVHLKPGDSKKDKERRREELAAVARWIEAHDDTEQDFFVVGDMNFKNCAEISEIVPETLTALNTGQDCLHTNTNVNSPRPYDNVLYPAGTNELFLDGNFKVINLIDGMEQAWYQDFTTPYPGKEPYIHNQFRTLYSDHHPVQFTIQQRSDDD